MNTKTMTEPKFESIFDYGSAFTYQSPTPLSKSLNRRLYKSVFSYHSVDIEDDENKDEVKEEDWIPSLLRKAITFQLYLLVILSFPLSFLICIKKIHALERIVLMRLGKLQPIRGPGYTFVLPFIDIWTRVDVRCQSFTVTTSQVLTADRAIVEVQAEVEYRVADIVSYVTKLSEQEKSLRDLALCCMTNVISEKQQEDLENNGEYICSILKQQLNEASLKWGLEIVSVSMYSVRILKAAEPVDALGTILTALRATMGETSDNTTAVCPLIHGDDTPAKEKTLSADPTEGDGGVLDVLKKVLSAAEEKALTKEVDGCFRFDIVGDSTKSVFCSFENGHASVVENPSDPLEPDVSVTLTEDNVRDFLDNKMSPLEAYLQGRVTVSGDWNMLRPLAKILKQPSCT